MAITKTTKKKNGLQQYRVRVGYTDIYGAYKQIERTAYGLDAAKTIESQLRSQIAEADVSVQTTLGQLIEDYMAAQVHEVRATTLAARRKSFAATVPKKLSEIKLSRLTVQVLQQWKDDVNNTDYALNTKRRFFASLNGALNWGVKRGYLPKNLLTTVGNFKAPEAVDAEDNIEFYTAEQFRLYAAAARKICEQRNTITGWGFYVFFCIAYFTGMRKGEINALCWSDIDKNIIHVRRSLSQELKGADRETAPKTRSSIRDLQIPKPLLDILAEHKARQMQEPRFSDSFRVCGGQESLRSATIFFENKRFAEAAGLPRIRIHDFRHSHAALLINEGINIKEIARRLGHSNVEITWRVYAHLYPREEERAMKVLNEVII